MLALGANGRGRAGLLSALRPQDVFQILTQPANQMQAAINALPFSPDLLVDKDRVATGDWSWRDSARGLGQTLASNTTAAETAWPGYSGTNNRVVFAHKQGPKYYKVALFTHASGVADTIDLSILGVVGWVKIKRRDAAGDWYVWTRSLAAGNNLVLNTTAAQSTTNAFISVSGTTLTFAAGAPAGNYVIEAWAHDPDTTNGIVQCGSFTTSGGAASVTLGWQPQFLLFKPSSTISNWEIFDTARGWDAGLEAELYPNLSAAENKDTDYGGPSSTGFTIQNSQTAQTFVYLAIRAPT